MRITVIVFLVAVTASFSIVLVATRRNHGRQSEAGCLSALVPMLIAVGSAFLLAVYAANSCAPNCDGQGPVWIVLIGLFFAVPAGLGGVVGHLLANSWTERTSMQDED
jgi:hypothetical protein